MAALLSLSTFVTLLTVATARTGTVLIAPNPGNNCPNGTQKLTTVAECKAGSRLAGIYGDNYNGKETTDEWPSGCYYCNDTDGCTDGTWFNTHPVGASSGNARPYCSDDWLPLEQGEMLMVGDSDIDYWRDWSSVFEDANNVGFGGYTCRDVLNESQLFIEAFAPSIVVLVCGENDLASGYSVSSTFEVFSKVVDEYILSGSKVIYIGTKPEPSTTSLHSKYQQYDQLIWKLAVNMSQSAIANGGETELVMIDSYGGFEALGNNDTMYDSDKLHLSAQGYGYWNQWVEAVLDAQGNATDCFFWRLGVCVDNEDFGNITSVSESGGYYSSGKLNFDKSVQSMAHLINDFGA